MSATADELYALAETMPVNTTRLETLLLAARAADTENAHERGIHTRYQIYRIASGLGRYEHVIEAYAWLRKAAETRSDLLPPELMLSIGAQAVDNLDPFASIPLAQIDALYDEQEKLHEQHGASKRQLRWERIFTELAMNRLEPAREAYEAWRAIPATKPPRCAACETSSLVRYFIKQGRIDEAFATAEPALDGRLKCDATPRNIYGNLLLTLVQRGEWDRARAMHTRTRSVLMDPTWYGSVYEHIVFAALDGSFTWGRRAIEMHLPSVLSCCDDLTPVRFHTSALCFFMRLRQKRRTVTLRFPETAMRAPSGVSHSIDAVVEWFDEAARKYARALDARNENDYFMRKIEGIPDLLKIARET